MHWVYVHAGLSSPNSPWYLFYSGIGSDWTRLLAFGALLNFTRQTQRRHTERLEQAERHHQERARDK